EQRLRRGRAETHDELRSHRRDLRLEPRKTGLDLVVAGLLVEPALAAARRLPFEVLHDVGHVDLGPIDAGLAEGAVEEPSRRTDERRALAILLVARLLTDEHDRRARGPFAEDGLRGARVEVAARARRRDGPQRRH